MSKSGVQPVYLNLPLMYNLLMPLPGERIRLTGYATNQLHYHGCTSKESVCIAPGFRATGEARRAGHQV